MPLLPNKSLTLRKERNAARDPNLDECSIDTQDLAYILNVLPGFGQEFTS